MPARAASSASGVGGVDARADVRVPAQVVGLPAEHDRRLAAPGPGDRGVVEDRPEHLVGQRRQRPLLGVDRRLVLGDPAPAGPVDVDLVRRPLGRQQQPLRPVGTVRRLGVGHPTEGRQVGAVALDRGPDAAAEVDAVAGRGPGRDRHQRDTVPLGEQLRVRAVPTGRQHDRVRRDLELGAVAVDLDTGHPAAGVGEQPGHRGAGPEGQVVCRAGLVELGLEHLEHRQPALDAVHGARDLVRLVPVDDPGGLRVERHAALGQPLDNLGSVLDGQRDQVPPAGSAADPVDVGQMRLGVVVDPPRALQAGAARGEVTATQVQGAADPAVLVDEEHAKAAARRPHGAGQARRTGSDHHHVVLPRGHV